MALNDTITALGNSIINLVDKKISSSGSRGLPIGTIIPVGATSNYAPDGSLPCDGAEYSKAQFSDLWDNYLSTNLINTCTYTEYASDLSTYGQCAKFAVDTVNNKFRVPLIKDSAVIQQALTDSELGKSYNAGLPNIEGSFCSGNYNGDTLTSGAFYNNEENLGSSLQGGNYKRTKDYFNASLSNPIYGNSDTVQPNAVALRYFVVVANGQINQSMMDWSAWASSLQGKANTDLSNLSDSGKKVIDGQWVSKTEDLSTSTAVGTYTIDLSSYLPNDNYNYIVQFHANWLSSNSTDGSGVYIASSFYTTQMLVARCTSSSPSRDIPIFELYIPKDDRTLTYRISTKALASSSYFRAIAYRRIGTNQ